MPCTGRSPCSLQTEPTLRGGHSVHIEHGRWNSESRLTLPVHRSKTTVKYSGTPLPLLLLVARLRCLDVPAPGGLSPFLGAHHTTVPVPVLIPGALSPSPFPSRSRPHSWGPVPVPVPVPFPSSFLGPCPRPRSRPVPVLIPGALFPSPFPSRSRPHSWGPVPVPVPVPFPSSFLGPCSRPRSCPRSRPIPGARPHWMSRKCPSF
ncbi:unnamed protein product [Boreogadus saida]